MREESGFDPDVMSPARAFGLMQLIVPTAQTVGKKIGLAADETTLRRPEVNVALGCRFLADLRRRFPSNQALAVPAYNAGPGAPERWSRERSTDAFDLFIELIPYEETRKYTKRVLTSWTAYLYLYDPAHFGLALALPKTIDG
jgi:soluble lytic murein transglycosylase